MYRNGRAVNPASVRYVTRAQLSGAIRGGLVNDPAAGTVADPVYRLWSGRAVQSRLDRGRHIALPDP